MISGSRTPAATGAAPAGASRDAGLEAGLEADPGAGHPDQRRPDGARPDTVRLGVDLGGTKIEAIALAADGRELARRRVATPRHDYEAGIAAIAALVAQVEAEAGCPPRSTPLGFGIPGSPSPASGLIRNANSTWLNGRPLQRDLEAALGRPALIANDANCLAASEATDGAGAGARVVWAVILGTGVGSGLAIDGRPLTGRNAIAGEWGHMPLPGVSEAESAGHACYCGRSGCVETFLSGPAFTRDHQALLRASGQPAPDAMTAQQVIAAMRAGDRLARASYQRYLERLARGLGAVINVLDPDIIVLGGGMSNVDELYVDLPAALTPHIFSDVFDTPVRKAAHGDSSGVRGAAWLWTGT
ncbi:ROK family protein [Camelimonas sp. ID_303_24]